MEFFKDTADHFDGSGVRRDGTDFEPSDSSSQPPTGSGECRQGLGVRSRMIT